MSAIPWGQIVLLLASAASIVTILGEGPKILQWIQRTVGAWRERPRPERELGFYELVELGAKQIQQKTAIDEHIGRSQDRYIRQTQHLTNQLLAAAATHSRWRAHWATRRFAFAITRHARDIQRALPEYRAAYRRSLRTALRIGDAARHMPGVEPAEMQAFIGVLQETEVTVARRVNALIEGRPQIEKIPRVTTALARARAEMLDVRDEQIQEHRSELLLLREARMALEQMHQRSG